MASICISLKLMILDIFIYLLIQTHFSFVEYLVKCFVNIFSLLGLFYCYQLLLDVLLHSWFKSFVRYMYFQLYTQSMYILCAINNFPHFGGFPFHSFLFSPCFSVSLISALNLYYSKILLSFCLIFSYYSRFLNWKLRILVLYLIFPTDAF